MPDVSRCPDGLAPISPGIPPGPTDNREPLTLRLFSVARPISLPNLGAPNHLPISRSESVRSFFPDSARVCRSRRGVVCSGRFFPRRYGRGIAGQSWASSTISVFPRLSALLHPSHLRRSLDSPDGQASTRMAFRSRSEPRCISWMKSCADDGHSPRFSCTSKSSHVPSV